MRRMLARPRIDRLTRIDYRLTMMPAEGTDQIEIDSGMARRIRLEICQCQGEEPSRRAESPLLQVNKAARDLNQPLIKSRLRLSANRQPNFLQHIVGLIVKLLLEAANKADALRQLEVKRQWYFAKYTRREHA